MSARLLEGRPAIVTGAAGGIGRGHILHLAAAGAPVVVNDINGEAAAALADEVTATGGKALVSTHDIGTRKGAEGLIKACIDAFGSIRIMVNNAGNLRDRTLLKMSDDDLDAILTVHVKGTFWCAQAAAAAMVEHGRGGVIINTTSGGHFGSFGQTAYSAAKGAIASMTYTWALELARYGIRVNAIGPLGTTAMSKTYRDADGNPGPEFDPTFNGPAVVYLCSDETENVSGQIFGTGGQRLSHMVQPHYGKTLVKADGWDIDSIRQHFQTQMPGEFGAFGILGKPYPFHAGVRAPEAKGD
ncbi:reductase [Croceicoccus estronivorus]|uniref:SDR family NAD(P)-dependent oxidoreductase n=1 Tax=Croceicoccus estronivorus TaxID=1172626 RepID=UPI000835EE14|nr:SDR family NAD(P)-dependent oxidoreductase [Croceicoccus estronivorus]OCC25139.1 reductase [Croceicoccus estronivorus]